MNDNSPALEPVSQPVGRSLYRSMNPRRRSLSFLHDNPGINIHQSWRLQPSGMLANSAHVQKRNGTLMSLQKRPPTPIIALDDVRVIFSTRTGRLFVPQKIAAVDGVSLRLMPGETIGLVGESGCGKSTTANVMCGLQAVTSGSVRFQGIDVTKRTPKDRKRIGRLVSVVFQDPSTALNARMTVQDQLIDPLVVHRLGSPEKREKRAYELLDMVGLPKSVLTALPGQLSGGQRQRVAIARALSLKPKVLIADEPTSSLDVSVRAQILNLLSDLKQELNLSMVFISHDIQTIRYISDRIMVMYEGKIVEQATTLQLFSSPKHKYTKMLLSSAPSLLHPYKP